MGGEGPRRALFKCPRGDKVGKCHQLLQLAQTAGQTRPRQPPSRLQQLKGLRGNGRETKATDRAAFSGGVLFHLHPQPFQVQTWRRIGKRKKERKTPGKFFPLILAGPETLLPEVTARRVGAHVRLLASSPAAFSLVWRLFSSRRNSSVQPGATLSRLRKSWKEARGFYS